MLNVVAIMVRRNGHLLMGQRWDDWLWNCPGGKVENGETTDHAAVRELHEETGIKPKNLNNLKLLGRQCVKSFNGKDVCVYLYELLGDFTREKIYDPDEEVMKWIWVPITKGLPPFIAKELHNKDDVILKYLGLQ